MNGIDVFNLELYLPVMNADTAEDDPKHVLLLEKPADIDQWRGQQRSTHVIRH
jgi:hypothetical protein